MKNLRTAATVIAMIGFAQLATAQHHHDDPELHVSPRWSECSFQIDPSLTQEAWHDFTTEAGLVAYFRPLADAKAMGAGHFEISMLQWQTKFDETKPAWNDTFVHPDSTQWLRESDRLAFPCITARVGITDRLDAALYFTKNPAAIYGFAGGQLQYNILNTSKWSLAGRGTFNTIYGPEDIKLSVYGIDALVSREFKIY